jgi:hypothetical protein
MEAAARSFMFETDGTQLAVEEEQPLPQDPSAVIEEIS